MHEGVVLGVAVSLTDPDADAVVLPQALLALHHPHLFPQGVPGHLVDALLLEVVAGPVAVDHELVGVEGGLGQTVSLLVLGVDVWEPQARVLLEPVGAHEGVPEGARELPAGLELVQVHELLVVPPVLGGEYDVVDEEVVDSVDALAQSAVVFAGRLSQLYSGMVNNEISPVFSQIQRKYAN